MKNISSKAVLLFGVSIGLSACQSVPNALEPISKNETGTLEITQPKTQIITNITVDDLTRYKWVLVDAKDENGETLEPASKLLKKGIESTLQFSASEFYTYFGCNVTIKEYNLIDNKLVRKGSISISSMMLCTPDYGRELDALTNGTSKLEMTIAEKPILTQKTQWGDVFIWRGEAR